MIPKKIHYCWFGRGELPSLAIKCIDSWKKFLPDYELVEWNESNFNLNCCDYVIEAYEAKKWAFVSDYARFWILYNYGGIYFDIDVEIINKIDDILNQGAFMGLEKNNIDKRTFFYANPGLCLAAEKNIGIYKEIIENYENSHFYNGEFSFNGSTVVDRVTNILIPYGLDITKNQIQKLDEITIYPSDYFAPRDYESGQLNITNNSRSIHHYMASWINKDEIKISKIEKKFINSAGEISHLGKLVAIPFRIKNKINTYGFKKTIIFIFDIITKKSNHKMLLRKRAICKRKEKK